MPKHEAKKFKQDPATTIGSFSKNLLGLKFMQRAKKEVEKKAELKEEDSSFDTSLCNQLKGKQQIIINPSYQFCEKLRFGRLSFKGMNWDIENLMQRETEQLNDSRTLALKRSLPSDDESEDNEIDNLDTDDDDEEDSEEDILDKIQ